MVNTKKLVKFASKEYGVEVTFVERGGHLFAYLADGTCLNSASNRNRGYSTSGKSADRVEIFFKDDLRRVFRRK